MSEAAIVAEDVMKRFGEVQALEGIVLAAPASNLLVFVPLAVAQYQHSV